MGYWGFRIVIVRILCCVQVIAWYNSIERQSKNKTSLESLTNPFVNREQLFTADESVLSVIHIEALQLNLERKFCVRISHKIKSRLPSVPIGCHKPMVYLNLHRADCRT